MPPSKWMAHVQAYKTGHPSLSHKLALQQASKTYRSESSGKKRDREEDDLLSRIERMHDTLMQQNEQIQTLVKQMDLLADSYTFLFEAQRNQKLDEFLGTFVPAKRRPGR